MHRYIDEGRLVNLFVELARIDSVSFGERKLADMVKSKLLELGIPVHEDDAGRVIGGNAGNLYGSIKGELGGGAILFSAHLDTVEPGVGKVPKLADGRIVSAGDTVLGADDAGGLAVILEALRILREQHIPHRDIEILFPVAEEVYLKGSAAADYSKISAKEAYVLDLSGRVGTASLKEPTLISFQAEVLGKSAHSGFEPEKGINAIAILADAIHEIKQGRIDEETTVNIGKISGGTATNAVPERVLLAGEVRSFKHQKALDIVHDIECIFREKAEGYGGCILFTTDLCLKAYEVDKNEKVVGRFARACERANVQAHFTATFGGSDNNSFFQKGIRGIVLASAMEQVHTVNEYLEVSELKQSLHIVLELMTSKDE